MTSLCAIDHQGPQRLSVTWCLITNSRELRFSVSQETKAANTKLCFLTLAYRLGLMHWRARTYSIKNRLSGSEILNKNVSSTYLRACGMSIKLPSDSITPHCSLSLFCPCEMFFFSNRKLSYISSVPIKLSSEVNLIFF